MIRIDDSFISIIHYKKIMKVSISEIHILMKHHDILIFGQDLYVYFLNKDEIILKGNILKVEFNYERI